MSVLIATPVVLPPRSDVLKSWDHRPHLIVVNGAREAWEPLCEELQISGLVPEPPHRRIYPDVICESIPLVPSVAYNSGVAASWNSAFREAHAYGIDHVALLSQNCVLHEGTSHLARLVDEYADERGLITDLAWHCIVLSVPLWEQLGPFDEQFHPAYYEDSDYCRRMFLAGAHTPTDRIPKVELDATCEQAASMKAGIVTPADYERNGVLYERMWGGPPFHERFTVKGDPMSVNEDLNWATHEALA